VLFAEDFDDRAPPPAPEPEPEEPEVIEPVFSAAPLVAARAAGHADGVSAGLAQAEAGHRQAVRVALQALAEQLGDARAAAREVVEATAEALARTLLGTLCAALPTLCARHGETELREILHAVLPSLTHEARVTVQISPTLVTAVGSEIATLGHDLASIVIVQESEELLPGDVRISWHHGAANRDTRAILAEIDAALGGLGLPAALPPPAAAPTRDRAGRKEGLTNVG
jgi:hypothetical protein